MFGIGPMELMAILVVALLVFGPKRIPELARTMGRGLAEFRRASNDLRQSLALDELERDLRQDPTRNQTIHRPDNNPDNSPSNPAQDRPSQAGDDVDLPRQEKPPTAGNEAPGEKQRGELPLGEKHDHEHHDVVSVESADEVDREASKTDPDRGEDSEARPPNNHPADSELGNVPVSAKKPADPQRG